MNPSYSEFRFPSIKANPWTKLFRHRTNKEAIDLISKILVYQPDRRFKPFEAMKHSYFDELRLESTTLPNGSKLPDLFDFSKEERSSMDDDIYLALVPEWKREQLKAQGKK